MALNFPDPAGQTPVNQFSPSSTPSATTNGATYFWDGVKWVSSGTALVADLQAVTDNGSTTTNGASFGATVNNVENTITAGSWDLSAGNFWTADAIAIPNPVNCTAGTSGLIRLTAAPTGWGDYIKHPDGAPEELSAFPAVVPFYVESSSVILLGTAAQGIA